MMTTTNDLRTVFVWECPPDDHARFRVAKFDPANNDALVTLEGCVVRTFSMFEQRSLLRESPWHTGAGSQCWAIPTTCWLGPDRKTIVGRRVALIGRVREAAGLKGLPPLRWLRMDGPGEPAEVCYLPMPTGRDRFYAKQENRDTVSAWLSEERRRYEAARNAWSTFDDSTEGRFAFRVSDHSLRWLSTLTSSTWDWDLGIDVLDWTSPYATTAVRALLVHLSRVSRWGGAAFCSVLAHSYRVAYLVRAAAPCFGVDSDACFVHGAAHDMSEGFPGIGDVPTPAKRWHAATSPEYRRTHREADLLALRLCGVEHDAEVERVVTWADRAAMAIERAAYFGDAPPFLGPHGQVAEAFLEHRDDVLELDRIVAPGHLLRALDGVDEIGSTQSVLAWKVAQRAVDAALGKTL